ncbi:MAG: hypothetical protein ACKO6E_12500 [Planctomycetota bacterium]
MTVDRATADAFHDAFAAVSRHVTDRYGVEVEVTEVAAPFKGDLDGRRILVGSRNDAADRLFLVSHLFGHTVQWNVSGELRRLGMTMPVKPDSRTLDALEAYERPPSRYSQQALHEAGVVAFDQWLADHSACDLAYLRHAYVAGERLPFQSFWQPGQPLVEPLAIPAFTPRRWRRRMQAIVI